MYACVKGCTNGLETKNQTLAHNVLISGLDGNPLMLGDIFHNTSCPQEFEFKVENHQMLSGSDINQTSSHLHEGVSMKDSIASDRHDIVSVNASRSQNVGNEVENCQSLSNSNGASDYLHTRLSITTSIGSDEHYTRILTI